ncbi:MAG: hypothetical protein A3H98_12935 [Bacteroidetes bacterium RIFCSPLOWO2_02_FULL_36_8]|nr:MAG: hypothetical protein A3H98_12935 [Bacteroidetes bacterium RIFCSPLOWO2_02_FULL_36_8]OFY70641.1 MAG: hypothetical protein A3G23_07890 [Bacteroidetes bacterium RIFCSPLOWO2_12_FULL_37_12]
MILSLVFSPPLSLKVFSQNDGSSCGKAIILPLAAELCNKDEYRIIQAEMWFEFTANAPEHEIIVSPSETQPNAEITKLKLFENKCPDLHLRKEVSSQPPELPRMRAEQLIVGQKYIVKAERETFTEAANFIMCLKREEVGGGDGDGGTPTSGVECKGDNAAKNAWMENSTNTNIISLCNRYQKLGFGTNTPSGEIDISSPGLFNGITTVFIRNTGSGSSQIAMSAGTSRYWNILSSGSGFSYGAGKLVFKPSDGDPAMILSKDGQNYLTEIKGGLGVGATPETGYKFHVSGNTKLNGDLTLTGKLNLPAGISNTGDFSTSGNVVSTGGYLKSGNSIYIDGTQVGGNQDNTIYTTTGNLLFGKGDPLNITNFSDVKIGVGTTSALSEKFEVNGKVKSKGIISRGVIASVGVEGGTGDAGGEIILADPDQPVASELKSWTLDNNNRTLRAFYNDGGPDGRFGFGIDHEGRMGIGKYPVDAYRLDVAGNTRINGTMDVTGDVTIGSTTQEVNVNIFGNLSTSGAMHIGTMCQFGACLGHSPDDATNTSWLHIKAKTVNAGIILENSGGTQWAMSMNEDDIQYRNQYAYEWLRFLYDDYETKNFGAIFSIYNTSKSIPAFSITQDGFAYFNDVVVVKNKIKVSSVTGGDYVFGADYRLSSLLEDEKFIEENKHLRGIPSAKEMKEKGLDLAEMNIKLLVKIEELTLHGISQQKQIIALIKQNEGLMKRMDVMENKRKK